MPRDDRCWGQLSTHPNDNGYYGYAELPMYWSDPNKYPFLIWVNKKLAGFVLVQKGSPIDLNPNVWDIAEFFIMRKFRKKGIGQFIAQNIWSQFEGAWQVRAWDNNQAAYAFWNNTIKKFLKKPVVPNKMIYESHDGLLVYTFNK
jgi:predicted acetyltransferase